MESTTSLARAARASARTPLSGSPVGLSLEFQSQETLTPKTNASQSLW
jgi:hypothetical protein